MLGRSFLVDKVKRGPLSLSTTDHYILALSSLFSYLADLPGGRHLLQDRRSWTAVLMELPTELRLPLNATLRHMSSFIAQIVFQGGSAWKL